jgi:hypothetical protein
LPLEKQLKQSCQTCKDIGCGWQGNPDFGCSDWTDDPYGLKIGKRKMLENRKTQHEQRIISLLKQIPNLDGPTELDIIVSEIAEILVRLEEVDTKIKNWVLTVAEMTELFNRMEKAEAKIRKLEIQV